MPRPFTPKVVTANRLREGDAVWMTADGTWSPRIAEALLIEDAALAEVMLVDAEAQAHVVVGAYLADAAPGPEQGPERGPERGPVPVHFREAFRTRGPSNYAHGKQAEAK